MALSLLSNLLTPSQQFVGGILSAARRFFGSDPSKMAQALSGSTNKKSPEYKSELRNVQRWYTTGKEKRKPNQNSLLQLGRYVKWKIEGVLFNINDSTPKQIPFRLQLNQQQVSRVRGFMLKGDQKGLHEYISLLGGLNPGSAKWWGADVTGVQPA